ncbi:MAG: hypothetical protein KAU44_05180 [Candidatus Marinimicrobia bacterium]|nr:hypothetical protein [Candidatus Neomarinimicrobiota bacterium]
MENQSKTSSINRKANALEANSDVIMLRRERFWTITLILIVIFMTTFYGTLKNPFINTFSKIGNYHGYRGFYIIWAISISLCIHISSLLLFKLTHFDKKMGYVGLISASFFLIITAIIPSLSEQLPFWHVLHKWTTFFYVMSMITALFPFFIWLGRKIPRLKVLLRNWQLIILIGSIGSLLIQGQTGIFELWFFWGLGTLMIYLCWILFTEQIEKMERNEQITEQEEN